MAKTFLLKIAGIVVVAAAAGVTHMAMGPKLDLDGPESEGSVIELPDGGEADPESPADDETTEAVQPDGSVAGTDGVLVLDTLELSLDQVRLLHERGLAQFIDARPAEEYEAGHIPGAWNIAPDHFDEGTPVHVDFLDDSAVTVAYCTGGDCHESHIVLRELQAYLPELKKVHVYSGGFPEWEQAGLEIETGPDPIAELGG